MRENIRNNFVLNTNKKHMPRADGEEEDARVFAVRGDSSSLPAPAAGNAKTSSALLSECALRFAGFEIFVDTWKKKTNVNARTTTFYFLTHAHQDHLRGLREDVFENDANGRIYCTEITKVLLVKRYPRLESKVKVLEFDSVEVVRVGSRNGDDGENNNSGEDMRFNVYTLDAGHCPGSAMFVFEGKFGKVLHTGDFRREDWSGSLPRGKRMSFPTPGSRGSFGSSSGFRRNFFGMINDTPLSAGMWSSSSASLTGSQDLGYDNSKATALKNATPLPKVLDNSKTPPVDVLYLDNTYNNPEYDHPPRAVALERIVKLVTEIEPERPVILLLDSLGKEDIVIALSQATKSKVYLHKDRYNDWLKLGFGKEYVCSELGENETTRVRVLPKSMGRNKENVCGPLVAGLKNSKEWGPLVISPTGWARVTEQMREEDERRDMDTRRREKMTNEEKSDWVRRSVPYSLHSSYRELETFVRRIQPRKIIGNTRDDTLKEAERKGLSEVRSVHVRRLEPLLRPSSQSEENPMLKSALEAERGYEGVAATTTKMNASKLLARMRLPSDSPRDEISDVRLLSASSPRGVKGDVKETLHKMRIVSPIKQATKYALANKKLPLRLQPIDKEQQQQQEKDREEENPEEDEMEEEETPEELSVPPLPPNRRRLPLPKSLTTRGGTAQKQRSNTKNDTHVENNVVLHSSEEELYNKSNLKSQPSVRGPSKQQLASRIPLVSNQKSDGFDALNAFLEKRMRQREEELREREKRKEVNDGEDGANIFENEENDEQDDDAEKKQEGEEEEEEEEEEERERQKQSQETVEDDDVEEEDDDEDDDIVPTQSADGAIGHGTEEEEVTATPVSPSKWFSSIIAPVKRLFFRGGEKKTPSQQQSQEENEEVDDRTTTFITAKVTDAEDNDDEAQHDGGDDAPDDAHEDTAGGDGDDDEEGEEGKGDAKDLDNKNNNNSGDGGNGDEDEDDKNDDEDDDMPIRRRQHRVRKSGSPPTDEELKEAVFEIVDRIKEVGGKRISPRETREELEKKFGCSLKAHKENIQKYIYFRTIEQDTTIVTTRRRNNSKERNRLKRKSELETEQEEDVSEEEEEEAREEEKEEKPEVKKRPQRKKKVKKLRKLNPLRYADSDASSEDDEDEEEEEEEDRDDAGNSGDDDDDDDVKDEMVDKDSESTDEEGKPPPKKQRINSTGAGQQQPQSFRKGRDMTRKQMTRMRATLRETQGSIPGTRSGANRKTAKESLNEREPKEPKEKGARRVSLLPTLPEMERAPPGTFYATAHLKIPRDVLERMVFEKTGNDYSRWKIARWKLAHMLDEGELLQAIADEKIKPAHVEKKKTGTYYVKKAERLALEKQYQELSKAKKEREGQVEEGQDRGQPGRNNVGGDGSDLQPKTIRFFGQGEEREDSDDTEGGTVVKSEIKEEEEEEEQDSEDDNDLRLLLEKMQVKRKMSEWTMY